MKHVNYLKKVFLPLVVMLVAYVQSFAAPLNGTYTIAGTTPNYTTLNAAVQDLILNGVSGPCVFNIRAGAYTDNNNTSQALSTWRTTIPAILGASATNTITFQAESGAGTVTMTATGTSSTTLNYVVKFNGCSYVIFKNLTMVNSNASAGRVIEVAGVASYNTVNNCILTGTTTTTSNTTLATVFASSVTGGNNSFTGNTINGGYYGIYYVGVNTTSLTDNNVFDNNIIPNAYGYGIYSYYSSNLKVRGNTITKTGSGTFYGVYQYYNYIGGLEIKSNTITCSAYSGTFYGINTNYNNNRSQVSFNTITANTAISSGSLYGIYAYQFLSVEGQRAAINNNTINLDGRNTTGTASTA